MGYEAKCRARVDDGKSVREGEGTVLIETDEVIVRGEARIRIPRTSIQRVASRAGVVTITSPHGTVSLALGSDAAKWEKRLLEPPKQLIDKLDVKRDAKVWLFHVDDASLIEQVETRTPHVSRGATASACDVVFVGVHAERDLACIDRAAKAIVDNGAIWVVHPKGSSGIKDTTIFARAKTLGLAAIKVARVSDTHTAEKLVWPVASRSKGSARA